MVGVGGDRGFEVQGVGQVEVAVHPDPPGDLSALAVPVALLIGQILMFAVPGSHWVESDVPVILIVVAGLVWAGPRFRSESLLEPG